MTKEVARCKTAACGEGLADVNPIAVNMICQSIKSIHKVRLS